MVSGRLNSTGEGAIPMPSTTAAPVRGSATYLHQLLAVRDGARAVADKAKNAAYHTIQKGEPLGGIERTHQPFDDSEPPQPREYKHVQVLAPTVVADFAKAMSRLFDVTAAVDYTNQRATADVVLPDGTVLVHDAPVAFLIFLEKKLVEVRAFIDKLPVLDQAIEWNDPVAPGEPYRSAAVETNSTRKTLRNHKVAAATEKHAEQVQVFQEDVAFGRWTTVKLSGGLRPAVVAGMRERVNDLIWAVKIARGQANMATVEDARPAAALFGHLFPDMVR